MFTTKFTKGMRKRPVKPHTKKFAEGGTVPLPEDDPRTEYRDARRTLQDPLWRHPVTVMEDVVGRFNESKGRDNALRDAVRRGAFEKIKKSGYEDR